MPVDLPGVTRPDLTGVAPEVVAYIETLEQKLDALRASSGGSSTREAVVEPSEPPTTINLISVSARGLAKRTPRHHYVRQRRGGMGVFDLNVGEDDQPKLLLFAEEADQLILVTDQGRAFRLSVAEVPEQPVHSRGQEVFARFPFRPDERIAIIVPTSLDERRGAYLAVVTTRGQVRRIAHQYLGKNLRDGTVLYDVADGGPPAASCWTGGTDDLFLVTQKGVGIRFAERLVPVRGCLGLRVNPGNAVVGICATDENGGVFLLNAEGKGTIRLMSGFGANKSPGGGGKNAMRADTVVGAIAVDSRYDLFAASRLGKLIRFQAEEVPPKEGVVQGVNCMNLRADECVALAGVAINR